VNDSRFSDLSATHGHEEKLREQSLELIRDDPELAKRLNTIEKAMAVVFGFSLDHQGTNEKQWTIQLVGIRLFNAAAAAVKLALSGYYQQALHQARDILEIGFLLDLFRTSPEKIVIWERSDRATRRKLFDPVKVRIALDERDGDSGKKREAEYNKLSELASHLTPRGFRMTTRGQFAEFGPFIDEPRLKAWLHEMVLRLGPSAVMYANHFPDADPSLVRYFQEFGTALIQEYREPKEAQVN
jgi:hypothetical protein